MTTTTPQSDARAFIFTGEQMILGQGKKSSEEEHLERYRFTRPFVQGKTVLDIACGTGYGTHIMSGFNAKRVLGVDLSEDAISYARQAYGMAGVEFLQASATSLPIGDSSIDVIVSFETIEHLNDPDRDAYLKELFRVIKKSGTLILSTPNRRITSPGSHRPLNPYHLREYTLPELTQTLLAQRFRIQDVLGQRVRRKILAFIPLRKTLTFLQKITGYEFPLYNITQAAHVISFSKAYEPRYYVVIASPDMSTTRV